MRQLLAWTLLLGLLGSCAWIAPKHLGVILRWAASSPFCWGLVIGFLLAAWLVWPLGLGVLAMEIRNGQYRAADEAYAQRRARLPFFLRPFF